MDLPLSSFVIAGLDVPALLASRCWLSRLCLRRIRMVAPIRLARNFADKQSPDGRGLGLGE